MKLLDSIRRRLGDRFFQYSGLYRQMSDNQASYRRVMDAQWWLLRAAPMIDMIPDYFSRKVTPFAYISPATFRSSKAPQHVLTDVLWLADAGPGYEGRVRGTYAVIGQTKWVLTQYMPEGRVIFSSEPLLGWEQ